MKIFPTLIPKHIIKIYLINNTISDKMLKKLIQSLFQVKGLQSIGIVKNGIGSSVIKTFA